MKIAFPLRMPTRKKRAYRINEISNTSNLVLTIVMTILAICTLIPVLLVVSVSLSSEEALSHGYKLIPEEFSLEAYTVLLKTGQSMARAYANTVFYSFTGTAMALIVMSLFAYVLSLKDFKARNKFAFYAFFTTMFSAGLVPAYFVNVRLLHLGDTIWIFLLPGLVAPFNVIILRTFMQTSIPDSLMEAARLDGASDWRIYWQIVMPLSKAGLATVGLTTLVAKWNDWFTGLLYIRNPDLIPLMTYLEKMQKNLDFLKANSQLAGTPDGNALLASIPTQSTRMAILVLGILPIMLAYPFFQKYFVKGLTVGSVKG